MIGPWQRCEGRPEWAHAVHAGTWVRTITGAAIAGATSEPLGFAAWHNAGQGVLASWFGRRHITLYETEDASLVMTLRRGFWRVWEVFDAEERPVGTVYRNALLTSSGQQIASPRQGKEGAFTNTMRQEIARFLRRSGCLELTFPETPHSSPFLRMVLLAAILSWPPEPR